VDRDRVTRMQRAQTAIWTERYESLSPREKEVMGLVVRGRLNKQIASELGTSEATVKMHRGHLMQKMEVDSLADLVRIGEILTPSVN
jgi:FixJ family two-component response regulator